MRQVTHISAKALSNCLFSLDAHILAKSKQLYPSLPSVAVIEKEKTPDDANRKKPCISVLSLLYLSQKRDFLAYRFFMMKILLKDHVSQTRQRFNRRTC